MFFECFSSTYPEAAILRKGTYWCINYTEHSLTESRARATDIFPEFTKEVLIRMLPPRAPKLELNLIGLGANGAREVAGFLTTDVYLESLWLSYCGIGDEGAIALAQVLRERNGTLTELSLDGNGIGDAGNIALAQALLWNSSLSRLWLRFNVVGSAGLGAFKDALEVNTTVQVLWLQVDDDDLSPEDKRKFDLLGSYVTRNKTLATCEALVSSGTVSLEAAKAKETIEAIQSEVAEARKRVLGISGIQCRR